MVYILVYIMTYYYSHLVLYIDIIYGIYTSIHYDILLLTAGDSKNVNGSKRNCSIQ